MFTGNKYMIYKKIVMFIGNRTSGEKGGMVRMGG